jgi:4-hydroxybenzoate polyprenyltransferase
MESRRSAVALGYLRLVHPFPSLLDAVVTAALTLLAGGGVALAARLGAAMLAIQFGIGALNDAVDAPRDAGIKPGKPIPAGLVEPRGARRIAGVLFLVGLGLSALSGPLVVLIALVGITIGALYDLALKGTAWSWLGITLGIPLLPVYAWLGATGSLPGAFAVLLPAAVLAGAALALGNALVDLERDREAGTASIAGSLGQERTWLVGALLFGGVGLAALGSLGALNAAHGRGLAITIVGLGVVVTGVIVARDRSADRRERGWELEALGTGLLAVGWVGALLDAGAL